MPHHPRVGHRPRRVGVGPRVSPSKPCQIGQRGNLPDLQSKPWNLVSNWSSAWAGSDGVWSSTPISSDAISHLNNQRAVEFEANRDARHVAANDSTGRLSGMDEISPDQLAVLVVTAARGDEDAWRELVDRFAPRVFGLIRAQCRDEDLAEEITQSTFCTIAAKLRDYEEVGRFESWLMRIAMNRLRDEMRRRARQANPADEATLVGLAGDGGRCVRQSVLLLSRRVRFMEFTWPTTAPRLCVVRYKDRNLRKDGLALALKKIGMKLTDAEFQDFFATCDLNGDGKVTRKELGDSLSSLFHVVSKLTNGRFLRGETLQRMAITESEVASAVGEHAPIDIFQASAPAISPACRRAAPRVLDQPPFTPIC